MSLTLNVRKVTHIDTEGVSHGARGGRTKITICALDIIISKPDRPSIRDWMYQSGSSPAIFIQFTGEGDERLIFRFSDTKEAALFKLIFA